MQPGLVSSLQYLQKGAWLIVSIFAGDTSMADLCQWTTIGRVQ